MLDLLDPTQSKLQFCLKSAMTKANSCSQQSQTPRTLISVPTQSGIVVSRLIFLLEKGCGPPIFWVAAGIVFGFKMTGPTSATVSTPEFHDSNKFSVNPATWDLVLKLKSKNVPILKVLLSTVTLIHFYVSIKIYLTYINTVEGYRGGREGGEEIEIFVADIFKRFSNQMPLGILSLQNPVLYTESCTLHPHKIIHFSILTTCIFNLFF